jgi:hypothetical protein
MYRAATGDPTATHAHDRGGIAVSGHDVGPNLQAAVDDDHIAFHVL